MADAGSSVPEAARAAARKAWADYIGEDPSALPRAVTRALDVALAAAVAEERATTERRIEAALWDIEGMQPEPGELFFGAASRAVAIVRAALASPGEES